MLGDQNSCEHGEKLWLQELGTSSPVWAATARLHGCTFACCSSQTGAWLPPARRLWRLGASGYAPPTGRAARGEREAFETLCVPSPVNPSLNPAVKKCAGAGKRGKRAAAGARSAWPSWAPEGGSGKAGTRQHRASSAAVPAAQQGPRQPGERAARAGSGQPPPLRAAPAPPAMEAGPRPSNGRRQVALRQRAPPGPGREGSPSAQGRGSGPGARHGALLVPAAREQTRRPPAVRGCAGRTARIG